MSTNIRKLNCIDSNYIQIHSYCGGSIFTCVFFTPLFKEISLSYATMDNFYIKVQLSSNSS